MSRLTRERATIGAMVRLYCRHFHGGALCSSCLELLQYAEARLDKCRFGDEKPACADCTVHCYRPAMRERVREVMRFAGPRMIVRHPYLALMHALSGRRG